jgi:hypothetical protein
MGLSITVPNLTALTPKVQEADSTRLAFQSIESP